MRGRANHMLGRVNHMRSRALHMQSRAIHMRGREMRRETHERGMSRDGDSATKETARRSRVSDRFDVFC
eukprot:1183374-Prorocentrum_minimum.AAC.2